MSSCAVDISAERQAQRVRLQITLRPLRMQLFSYDRAAQVSGLSNGTQFILVAAIFEDGRPVEDPQNQFCFPEF